MVDPILIHRGAAESILLQLSAAANFSSLAGCTVRLLIRRAGRITTLLDALATVTDAVARTIQVDLTAAQTATLNAGEHEAQIYVYRAGFPNDPIIWPLEQSGCDSDDGGAYPVRVFASIARLS